MKLYALVEDYNDNSTPPHVILQTASLSRIIYLRETYMDNINQYKKCHDCLLHTIYTNNNTSDFSEVMDVPDGYGCFDAEMADEVTGICEFSDVDKEESINVWKCVNRIEASPAILNATYHIEIMDD